MVAIHTVAAPLISIKTLQKKSLAEFCSHTGSRRHQLMTSNQITNVPDPRLEKQVRRELLRKTLVLSSCFCEFNKFIFYLCICHLTPAIRCPGQLSTEFQFKNVIFEMQH